MLRKFVALLFISLIAAGCSDRNQTGMQNAANTESIPHHDEARYKRETDDNKNMGYVRYKAEDLKLMEKTVEINREELAHSVAQLILQNGGFTDVAALATDREILIAYKLTDKYTSAEAMDIAKKTAQSVAPGYYKIYTSDEPNRMNDIESLHNSKTNENIRSTIDQIVKEMKQDNND